MKKHLSFLLVITFLSAITCINVMGQNKKAPSLNHYALYIFNLSKSTAFYRDVIGLDTIPEPFHDGKHTWFKIGEHSQLHIIEGAKEILPHDINTHLCFSVSSVDDFVVRLNQLNIKYYNARSVPQTITVRPDGVKQIYFQDPDNYWVEINDDKY